LLTAKGLDPESPGIILYDVNTTKQTILFTMVAVEGTTPKLGDKVDFLFLLYCSCLDSCNWAKSQYCWHACL